MVYIELDECSIENVDALILPGGDTWAETIHEPILKTAQKCLMEGILVAAICGQQWGLPGKGCLIHDGTRAMTWNTLKWCVPITKVKSIIKMSLLLLMEN